MFGLHMGRMGGTGRGGVGASPSLGPIATGNYFPTGYYSVGGHVGYNSYTAHWATENIASLQLVFVAAMANNAVGGVVSEHVQGLTDNVVTCVIEYPVGIYTRIKKDAVNAINVGIGAFVVTDAATVSIPSGAKFIVHTYWAKQGGGLPNVAATYDVGNGVLTNEATPTDKTGTFSILAAATNWAVAGWQLGPQAIIANTTKRTFALIGDSRTEGVQAGKTDANKGCTGEVALSIYNAGHGMLNLGIGNDRASKYIDSHALRLQLAGYCSEVVLGFGANDIFFDSAATILANTQTIRGYFAGKPAYLYTLPPVAVTSTDSYATVANQTAHPVNPARVGYNALLRAAPSGITRVWEIADVLESSRDSGKWRVDLGLVNGNNASGDPTHENNFGNATIAESGAIVL